MFFKAMATVGWPYVTGFCNLIEFVVSCCCDVPSSVLLSYLTSKPVIAKVRYKIQRVDLSYEITQSVICFARLITIMVLCFQQPSGKVIPVCCNGSYKLEVTIFSYLNNFRFKLNCNFVRTVIAVVIVVATHIDKFSYVTPPVKFLSDYRCNYFTELSETRLINFDNPTEFIQFILCLSVGFANG